MLMENPKFCCFQAEELLSQTSISPTTQRPYIPIQRILGGRVQICYIQGDGLFWLASWGDRNVDIGSYHGGCPILEGQSVRVSFRQYWSKTGESKSESKE